MASASRQPPTIADRIANERRVLGGMQLSQARHSARLLRHLVVRDVGCQADLVLVDARRRRRGRRRAPPPRRLVLKRGRIVARDSDAMLPKVA